ncbi:MAG: hypothetical protein WCG44_03625 [bacterium]
MHKKFSLLIIVVTLSLCHGTFTSKVQAQSTTLSVSPPVVEIMLAPGKSATQTFNLKAEGDNLRITPTLHLIKPSDSFGHTLIDPNPLNQSSLPLTVNISGPSTSPTLTFEAATTDVPADYYLALVFTSAPGEPTLESSATLPGISALILVTVNPSGVIPIDLSLEDFSPPLYHDSWLSLTISPQLKNNTGIMIRPEGKFEIISPTGKTLLSRSLYPNLVLGHSTRTLQSMVDDLPSTLTWNPKWSNIGPYRVRLTINTLGGTKIVETEKTIWILPLRLLITLIAISIVVLTLLSKPTKFKRV